MFEGIATLLVIVIILFMVFALIIYLGYSLWWLSHMAHRYVILTAHFIAEKHPK